MNSNRTLRSRLAIGLVLVNMLACQTLLPTPTPTQAPTLTPTQKAPTSTSTSPTVTDPDVTRV